LDFAHGKHRILISKTKIAGIGMNFQNCHNMIFASPDFSFEQLYQAIRREYRFGQTHNVNVWLIVADTMGNVRASLKQKEEQFKNLIQFLTAA
jgi:SNF2 family DNA or RNA helicase